MIYPTELNRFRRETAQVIPNETPPVNPHWLAFFRKVRELAELAREREADAQVSGGINPAPSMSGKHPAATSTLDKKLAPAGTGATANPLDY